MSLRKKLDKMNERTERLEKALTVVIMFLKEEGIINEEIFPQVQKPGKKNPGSNKGFFKK